MPTTACTGCTACASVCPKHCIHMQPDREGFLHPAVDAQSCIHCGLCTKTCPVLHPIAVPSEGTRAYAALSADEPSRMHSTSGGIFSLLADWVIRRGGTVYGAAYQSDFSVAHCAVTRCDQLQQLRTAKYAQSTLGDTFSDIRRLLTQGCYVLFSGTPCQVAGLQAFLKKPWDKLILVDLICHGVPSPQIWQAYLHYRQQTDAPNSSIQQVNLRSKETGWPDYSIRFSYEDGTVYTARSGQDPFLRGFVGDLYLRPSCYGCPFKGIERSSDFTLADYWGIEEQLPDFHDGKGTSLVFVHSEKAAAVWDSLQDQLRCQAVDPLSAVSSNPSALRPSPRPEKRPQFWQRYQQEDFDRLVTDLLYTPAPRRTILRRILNRLKKIIRKQE